jgi:hypothetical protein
MEERRQKFTQLQTSKQVICGTHSSGEKMWLTLRTPHVSSGQVYT